MLNDVIREGDFEIKVVEIIDNKRRHSEIYLAKDQAGNPFIVKRLLVQPKSTIGYAVRNHYGRTREGSASVFAEIQAKSRLYDFLAKPLYRINHDGFWLVVIEFIEGELLSSYLERELLINKARALEAVRSLAYTLALWHNNGFAHGDPHLANAIIDVNRPDPNQTMLIDYSLIHHKDFHQCKNYGCFEPDPYRRIREDLMNSDKLGSGFRSELEELLIDSEHSADILDGFDEAYRKSITFDLK